MRHIRRFLTLLSLILFGSLTSHGSAATVFTNLAGNAPSSNSVVVLATTVTGGASSIEAVEAIALGYDVVINNAATWGAMTQANFASYRAIILGDPNCQTTPAPIAAAVTNRTTWSPAITGNMIIIGVDPAVHPNIGTNGKGTELTHDGIAFAAADPTRTGAYITLSCYYVFQSTAIPLPLLDQFGTGFVVEKAPSNFNNSHIVATHPAFVGLTDSELSNWGQSVHEIINQWPVTFQVFAIAPNVGSAFTATDGTVGTPYILTRGTTVISSIQLGPVSATNPVGTTHTVTASISPVPPPGTLVTFKIISGPNVSQGTLNPPVGTNAGGMASKTYSDTGGAGTDYIVATYIDSGGKVQTSNTVTKTWVAGEAHSCAEFSATTVCQGTAMEFTDLSIGGTSWNWNFGDSTTSTQQNPTHVYTNPGTYNVTLSVNGGACTVTHTVTVTAAPPVPIISGPSSTCSKTGTYCIPRVPGVNYTWNVTNGTMSAPTITATQVCITVTWNATGNGMVSVKATNSETCCSSIGRLIVQSCEDFCCGDIRGNAVVGKDPQSLGGGLFTITPTLSASGNIVRVTATVISSTQAFTSGTGCGTSGPVNSYIRLPLSSVTGFTSLMPVVNGREVIWSSSSGANISAGVNFPFNVQFPPLNSGPAGNCSDIIRFCVKYTFTDDKCHACEIIRCYEVVRSAGPGGGIPIGLEIGETR